MIEINETKIYSVKKNPSKSVKNSSAKMVHASLVLVHEIPFLENKISENSGAPK